MDLGILAKLGRKRRDAAVLVLILALAAVLRLLPTRAGLPYIHEWDEPLITAAALQMLKTGDLDPHFFHYGSLTIYAQLGVDVAHYFSLLRHAPIPFPVARGVYEHEEIDLGAIHTWFDTGWLWEISHPSFVLWNRGFNALLGTLTVLATFVLGRRLAGGAAGLLAAALLAVQGFHIGLSAVVNPDVAMALMALLAVHAALVFADRRRPAWLLASLAATGLAASAKYPGVFCGVAPLAALVVASRRERPSPWLWAALPAVPALAFLATTPYALLDLPAFLSQAGFEVYHYMARGHAAVDVQPGWDHLLVELRRVGEHFGVVPALCALAGAALLLRRRRGVVALIFPLGYFLYLATTRVDFHRNLLAIYPHLAIGAAVALVAAFGWLREPRGPRPRLRRLAATSLAAVLAVAIAIHLGQAAFAGLASGWRSWTARETRSQAVDALDALAREEPLRVGLAAELRVHPLDLARLEMPYEVAPHLELVCDPARFDVLVTGATYVGLWPTKPEAKRLAAVLNGATPGGERRLIEGPPGSDRVTRIDGLSANPAIVLTLTRRQARKVPDACAGRPQPESSG